MSTRALAEFDESLHPRDHGKFAPSPGGDSSEDGGGTPAGDTPDSAPDGFPKDTAVRSGDMNEEGLVDELVDETESYMEDVENPGGLTRAIQGYVGSDFTAMNGALRASPKKYLEAFEDGSWEDKRGMAHDLGMIQDAIENAPELNGLIVYRGTEVSDKVAEKLQTPGSTFKVAGFQSTSIDPTVATEFGGGGHKLLFEIKASKGLFLTQSAEREVLMPHGARYRFLGTKTIKIMYAGHHGFAPKEREVTVHQLEQLS